MKRCTKCGKSFPATSEFFHRSKAYNDGFKYTCKSCRREYEHQLSVANGGNEWDVVKSKTGEEWRDAVGFDGFYSVSNFGRVKRAKPGPGTFVGNLMTPVKGYKGYLYFCLNTPLVGVKSVVCHKLVAYAFVGNRPDGMQINHIDGNKENNFASNLEYVTPSYNVKHSYRLGLASNKGERHPNSIITEDCARKIIKMIEGGKHTLKEMAALSGATFAVVSGIKYNGTWSWLK